MPGSRDDSRYSAIFLIGQRSVNFGPVQFPTYDVQVRLALGLLSLAVIGLTLASCGGDGESDAASTPVASVASERSAGTPDADDVITVVARNLAFDTDELLAPAGNITIELDNQDSGTPHNIHFFRGGDAQAETAGETPIEDGRSTERLEMDLAAGEYFFQCDVHPNMHGTLTVS